MTEKWEQPEIDIKRMPKGVLDARMRKGEVATEEIPRSEWENHCSAAEDAGIAILAIADGGEPMLRKSPPGSSIGFGMASPFVNTRVESGNLGILIDLTKGKEAVDKYRQKVRPPETNNTSNGVSGK